MKTTRRSNRGNPTRGERGIALVIALWVMVLLYLLGVVFLNMSGTESTIASNEVSVARAFNIAEAGLERAKARIKNGPETPLNAYLPGPPSPPGGTLGPNLYTNVPFDEGNYTVVIEDDNDDFNQGTDANNRVLIRATGTWGMAQKHLLALVEKPPIPLAGFSMGCGESTQQVLTINGNPTIAGSNGSVHSNCNFNGSGDYSISQNLSAVGTITNSGSPTIGGQQIPGADPRPIPAIVPTDYKKPAYMQAGDYIMRETAAGGGLPATAGIYQVTGFDASGPVASLVFDATGGGKWPDSNNGWQYSGTPGAGGKWTFSGNNPPSQVHNKAFYFEKAPGTTAGVHSGNVQISSSSGSSADPWKVTIIAEGHIDVSGNPTMQAADHTKNILMIAGTDISNSGNATSTWSGGGVIAAHEQISISGNPEFVGVFVAENAAATDNFVTSTSISGNPTITYNTDNGAPGLPAAWYLPLTQVAWRELP